jgi:tetratricopeptide (TPR) repeat protein
MYMGQMTTGQEAVQYFVTGIMLMKKSLTLIDTLQANAATTVSKQTTPRDVSSAYCAIAEIYMTDACDEPDADEKCKQNLDLAIDADPTNAETYHTLASYWLCKGDRQSAVEAMDKGVSLWLPQLRNAVKPEGATLDDPVEVCPLSYPARINCAKTLIELENYEVASEILELLLDENDEVVEVWYLLGLLNYLQGSDFKNNARHYLKKGLELAAKLRFDDADMLSQMNQLLMELGPSTESDDEEDEEQKQGTEDADDGGVEMDSDSDVDDAQQETTNMDH